MSDCEDKCHHDPNRRGKAEKDAYSNRVGADCRRKPAEKQNE
jgi:hypothetical protein